MPKLAEALIERKDLQGRYNRICARLKSNAKVQDGEQPSEQPGELIDEARRVLDAIQKLTIQINHTNSTAILPGDGNPSLMEAIAQRDRPRDERLMLEQFAQSARIEPSHGYGTRTEVKWYATMSVADIQREIDALSQAYRLLDTRIQEANWIADLLPQN